MLTQDSIYLYPDIQTMLPLSLSIFSPTIVASFAGILSPFHTSRHMVCIQWAQREENTFLFTGVWLTELGLCTCDRQNFKVFLKIPAMQNTLSKLFH